MASVDLEDLQDGDWSRLQALIERFETAWIRGERPRIDDHIPAGERHREALLVELVHAELEFRIKVGESARVEDYLRRYPGLESDRATVLGLIRAEWSLRRRREPGLTLDRFRARFPEFRDELPEVAPAGESTLAAPIRSGRPGPPPLVPAEGPLPRRLGKFELRQRVGAGSFGVVYRAWDTVLNREVALKVPRTEAMAAPSDIRAFLREARNAIDLRHPHIVAIHDAGPIEGTVCLVRAFVEGMTLAERLKEAPIGPEEAAALMLDVAGALAHAHGRGIIHRDLKPSNILLDREGRPHVSDFGLAKREAGDTTLSPAGQVGTMIGTPAYMSPEQARGEAHLVDGRSDVYSAGVVLYEMLTGSVPFRGRGRMLQIQIQEAEPTPPRSLNDDVARDLETICLRALAKSPEDRYPTARALGDDLENFLHGRPVVAKLGPPSASRPGTEPTRGHLAAVAVPLILMAALIGTAAVLAVTESRRRAHSAALVEAVRGMEDLAQTAHDPGLDAAEAHRRFLDRVHARAARLLGAIRPEADPKLREATAGALARLAERESSLGSDRVASGYWAELVRQAEAIRRDRPGDPGAMEALARALRGFAGSRGRLGFPGDAARITARAVALWEEILEARQLRAEARPEDVDARLDLAEAEVTWSGLGAAREADLDGAERVLAPIDRGPSLGPDRRRRLAGLDLAIARRHLDGGNPSKARWAAARCLYLAEAFPNDPGAGADLARSLLLSARAGRMLGMGREALDEYRRASERFEALALEDPGAVETRRDLGAALFEAGVLQVDRLGGRDHAIESLGRSLVVRRALRRSNPRSHLDLAGLAATQAALGSALGGQGRFVASASAYLQAVGSEVAAIALAPGVEDHRRDLVRHVEGLARLVRATTGLPRFPPWPGLPRSLVMPDRPDP